MQPVIKPHDLYCRQMIEVKRRFKAIDRILGAKKPITQNQEIDNECAFLQVRKIIELITFSILITDKLRYQKLRELDAEKNSKDKGDYTLDWNAPDILNKLSRISPFFLPRPLGTLSELPDGTKHFNESKAKLTQERLIDIYKIAGRYAHIQNPYKPNLEKLENTKVNEAKKILIKEVAYLKSVIWEHAKIGLLWDSESNPTELENSESAWLIWFGS